MVKTITCKCVLFSLLTFTPSIYAGEFKSLKLRALSAAPKVSKSRNHKKIILDKINDLVGDDIDLTLFDKKKDGLSIYAKISRVSRIGLRYNF